MIDDVKELKELHSRLTMWNADQTNVMIDVLRKVKKNEYKKEDLVDLGFFLREMEKLADEIRKECYAKKEFIGKVLCVIVAQEATEDPDKGLTIHGEFASGTADVKKAPGIPKFGTAEYTKLCKFFKIAEDTRDTGVVQFHFKRLGDYISDMMAEGKDPPPGISTTYNVYRTLWRKKR